MPISNPEDAIISGFKRVCKRKKNHDNKLTSPEEPICECPITKPDGDVSETIEISDDSTVIAKAQVIELNEPKPKELEAKNKSEFDEALLPSPSASFLSVDSRQKDLDEQSKSSTDSAGSYLSEEPQDSHKNIPKLGNEDQIVLADQNDKINAIVNQVIKAVSVDNEQVKVKTNTISSERRNGQVGDRRRNTWLPCTCPQYKVSCELATKCNAQALFFAKMMVVKWSIPCPVNVHTYNDVISRSVAKICGFDCDTSIDCNYCIYLHLCHSNLQLCPPPVGNCYCAVNLFDADLYTKFVMHRITNFAGFGLTIVSSVVLLFLKELESKELTYIQFVSHVWLPALLLSQLVVMVSILEIQRMLFGLSFNVSTKRWHIAALYL
ncbi:hypothetical protein Ocin01_10859 [Orchesella cincta]|uniref:Uncharacterized protein n=1 Tax=Orchesella cincta TaxID=48709 RepID=A0A1D2MSD0_ORCCI|nr:hypothetical protein Ocin01_10859 [Orchesella cincta]